MLCQLKPIIIHTDRQRQMSGIARDRTPVAQPRRKRYQKEVGPAGTGQEVQSWCVCLAAAKCSVYI